MAVVLPMATCSPSTVRAWCPWRLSCASAEVYLVEVDRVDPIALAHACWEIGNMHAPLFRGDSDEHTVRMYTPLQPVLGRMLRGVEGVRLSVVTRELDADRRLRESS